MSIKIVFFGYRQSGKTKLIKRMFNPEVPKNFRPMPTPGLVVDQITSLQIPLEIWDTFWRRALPPSPLAVF